MIYRFTCWLFGHKPKIFRSSKPMMDFDQDCVVAIYHKSWRCCRCGKRLSAAGYTVVRGVGQ